MRGGGQFEKEKKGLKAYIYMYIMKITKAISLIHVGIYFEFEDIINDIT